MTLVVVCPWVIAEIILIIDALREGKFVGGRIGGDTSIGKTGDGDLALLELRTERAK